MGSDYFYHFVHTLNIFAFAILLTTGIGTYYLRKADRVGKAFLRFCLIMSFWSFWGIVSYVLEPRRKKRDWRALDIPIAMGIFFYRSSILPSICCFPTTCFRRKNEQIFKLVVFPGGTFVSRRIYSRILLVSSRLFPFLRFSSTNNGCHHNG